MNLIRIPTPAFLSLPSSIRAALWRHTSQSLPASSALSRTNSLRPSNARQYATAQTSEPSSSSSVDPSEISLYNSLASSWWDPQGSSRLLHLMNPLRHQFMRRCRESEQIATSKRLRYLDVGCGGGIFAESAARLADTKSVTGLDPTPEVITVATRHQLQDPLLLEQGRLNYINAAIEDLPVPQDSEEAYDVVTLFEVIEHVKKPSPFLRTCLDHLKPGGWLIGSTIARTNVSWFTTKLMAEDVLRLVPRGTHDWNQYIQPQELRQWARVQPELDVEGSGWRVMGVVYVPGLGWKEVPSSEQWGNYFFGIRRRM